MNRGSARDRVSHGRSCSGCGRRTHPEGAPDRLGADLGMLWLIAEAGQLVERRFCQRCAPHGPVTDVTCSYCGDGPLLAGDLDVADAGKDAAVRDWLSVHDWLLDPAPTCPGCRRAFGPRRR